MTNRRKIPRILALLVAAAIVFGSGPSQAAGAEDRLVVGLKAFRDGFHDLAAKELRAFLEAAPRDRRRVEVLYVLAQAEIARSEWSGARAALEQLALTGGPRAHEALYWLGWVALQEKKTSEALAHLDAYLDRGGGDRRADVLWLSSDLARSLGKPKKAARGLAAFLEAAPRDPRRPAAWVALVEAASAADQPAEARDLARKAMADPGVRADRAALEAVALGGVEAARKASDPKAEAEFWDTLGKHARTKKLRNRALYEEGQAHLRGEDGAGARGSFEQYLEADPAGPYVARTHLALADLALKEGDRRGALAHLEGALSRPSDPEVAPRLAELRKGAFTLALTLGDDGRAVVHGRDLLASGAPLSSRDQGLVHSALGRAAVEAGDVEGALEHWGAVPPDSPEYREARLLAAQALVDLSRPEKALEHLEPLLAQQDPNSEAHLAALAAAEAAGDLERAAELSAVLADRPPPGTSGADFLHRRGLHLQSLGDAPRYAMTLEALATGFPDDPRAGWAAGELEKQAYGAEDWEEVLRWAPMAKQGSEGETAAYLEAEALWALERAEEAREAFRAVADAGGRQRAPALARLGTILDASGKREEAVSAYQDALGAGLEGESAEWVRSRLSALRGEAGVPAE